MMLEISGLSAGYGKAIALENLNLQIKAGELVSVLGPNGAGKSTLLKVISRAISSQGQLRFGDNPCTITRRSRWLVWVFVIVPRVVVCFPS